MNTKIVVVGSLNMDVVVKVDSMPRPGETVMGRDLRHIPGGKGANQACAAGRLSGNTAMLGKVGADQSGEALLASLSAAGVDVSGIQRVKTPTGTALIWVDGAGDNSIVVAPGANGECDLAYLEAHRATIGEAGVVMTQMEIPHETIYGLIRMAKGLGKTVILDPAPAPRNFPVELYPLIDYITPNETELEILTGMPVTSVGEITWAAKALLEKGAGKVVVTCGKLGAMLVGQNGWELFPVVDVPVADSTAAGDSFNAGFAVALTEGKSEAEAMIFANRVSTLVVTREGAQNSIPSREEVDGFDEAIQKIVRQGKGR